MNFKEIKQVLRLSVLQQRDYVRAHSRDLSFLIQIDYLADHIQMNRTNLDDGEHWLALASLLILGSPVVVPVSAKI